jgi:hypothetical protein
MTVLSNMKILKASVHDWRLHMENEICLILALFVLMGITEKPSLRMYFYIIPTPIFVD